MSHDLVSLGIATQNMAPNNPSLDSRPLFQAALNYAQSHPVQTLTLDTGAYYLLSNTQSNGVLMFANLTNLTVDLAGSTLFFNGPLVPNGLDLYYCSNLTLTNFQIDYVHPPYTHVQVTSIDTVNRLLRYQTLPGWPDPAEFNTLVDPFSGGPIQGYWATIFRNGSIVPGTTRTLLQAPFTNNTLTIQDQSPWAQSATLSTLQAGDTAVVYARGGGPIMWVFFGDGLTFSNISIYGSQGIQLLQTSNTTMENMRFAPRPGSGLVGGVGGIAFLPPGPSNHILNSYVARTLDDALVFEDSGPATVVSQSGSRELTVANQGYRFPNGTTMNFVDPGTTVESVGGVIVDQNPPDNPNPAAGNVTVTFDRDLPTIAPGTFLVFGSAATRGQGSTVEDSLVEDTYGGHGILLQGVEGITVQRNVVRRTSMAGIHVNQSADAAVDSADLNPPSHDVVITDNVLEATLGPAPCGTGIQFCLGAIEIDSTNNQAFGFASSPANTNITVQNNYIADTGRSGIWVGELNGGTLQNNQVIGSSQNPTLGGIFGIPPPFQNQVMQDALVPVVIHYSTGVTETGDTITSAPVTTAAPVTLTPSGANLSTRGGAGSFTVQTAISGFDWRAVSDSSWLTVTSGSGPGSGAVAYSVAANTTGIARTGNIVIAGISFSVAQTAPLPRSAVGIYRSSNGLWLENSTFNNMFTSADTVTLFAGSGLTPQAGDIPVAGDWNGTGTSKIGLYRPSTGTWFLDKNGNGVFDGPTVDLQYQYGGVAGDIPVVGDWNGSGTSKIGIFRAGFLWLLDANGNGMFDSGDQTFAFGGAAGCTGPLPGFYNSEPAGSCDIPVVGDWNQSGTTKVGVVRAAPGTAQPFLWILDTTGLRAFGPSSTVFGFGGIAGDVPVIGDWNNSGATQIGVFRAGFLWIEDTTAKMPTPPAATDTLAVFGYGGVPGDIPVVGHW